VQHSASIADASHDSIRMALLSAIRWTVPPMNQVALALAWAGMVLAAIELTLRILGLHRFPLFRSGGASVYHMRERQRGAFRHRSTWIYNECGMRTDRPFVASPGAVIVLGDSVVDGGLRISQDEMLARGIEAAAPVEVFPLACHGWAMRNQIEALAALPGWRNCGALVWVLNPGDFDTIGQGGSAFSFPEHRPWLLSLWLLRRYLLRRRGSARQSDPSAWPTPDPALRSGNLERAQDVLRGFEGIIVIVHFPARENGRSR
jgi:hypothetical protein